MGFHPESGGICINENSGYHCFQGYPLVCLIPLYIIFKPRGSESPSEVWFPCYLLLHHSQTILTTGITEAMFEYHLLLHHSQTSCFIPGPSKTFEYHLLLHHSQTSNSKMKCHHLHKAWYSNTLINFTSVFIYNITNPPFQASPFLVFDK